MVDDGFYHTGIRLLRIKIKVPQAVKNRCLADKLYLLQNMGVRPQNQTGARGCDFRCLLLLHPVQLAGRFGSPVHDDDDKKTFFFFFPDPL